MAKIKEDDRSLIGPQKAGMMFLSLPQEYAGKLLAMMEDDELKELSQMMSNLGTISSNLVERLVVDFADAVFPIRVRWWVLLNPPNAS